MQDVTQGPVQGKQEAGKTARRPGKYVAALRTGIAALLLVCSAHAAAANYTVLTLGDGTGACIGINPTFVCTSLRAAITASNATVGVADTITFAAAGTINVGSALPIITDTLAIDGGNAITLDGGGSGFSALHFSGAGARNSRLLDTAFARFNQSTVLLSNTSDGVIQGNAVVQPTQSFDAIRVFNSTRVTVENNTTSSGFYGIVVFNTGAIAGYSGTVRNNDVTGARNGIALFSADNVTISGNTIRSSVNDGIRLGVQGGTSLGSSNNTITGNLIENVGGNGINVTPLNGQPFNNNRFVDNTITGSGGDGIRLDAGPGTIHDNTVSGSVLRGNGGAGIALFGDNAANNAFFANAVIAGNGGLGIDLGAPGVNANDAGDADSGPNRLQNFPVVTRVNGTAVHFVLDAQANASGYRIDFYSNPGGVDPSGHGEGQAWLAQCVVATPSTTVPTVCTVPGANAATLRLTATRCRNAGCVATATTSIGETSEFSGPTRGTIVIVKDAVPDDAQDFAFTTVGTGLSAFSLDDDADGTLGNTQTFLPVVPGSYRVTEALTTGWLLSALVCVDPDNGSTVDLATRAATIDLDAGEQVTCTFTNRRRMTDVSVVKTASPATAIAGGTLTFTLVVSNLGPMAADNTVVRDDWTSAPGLNCSAGPATCSAAGAGTQCPAPASVTPAALQAGLAIPALPAGGVATFTLPCTVTATGVP